MRQSVSVNAKAARMLVVGEAAGAVPHAAVGQAWRPYVGVSRWNSSASKLYYT
jgi:hypothetical protein